MARRCSSIGTPCRKSSVSHLIEAGSGPGLSNIAAFNTGSSQTFLVVPGVPPGVYYVRVRAVGSDGIAGPPSNEIELRVGGTCSTSPGIPTGFTHSVAGNTVTLSWNASAGVDPPTSYVVEAGSAPGLSNITVFDTGSAATSLSAFAPNGVYYVRIRARNACGTSGASNERTIGVGVTLTTTPTTTVPRRHAAHYHDDRARDRANHHHARQRARWRR